jgi:lantibiotic modifying enzyme
MKAPRQSSSSQLTDERGTSPYLAAAFEIGQQLVADAVPQANGATWEGDHLIGSSEEDCAVVHGLVGPDLYGGAAGIGWFLGHLAAVTSSPEFERLSIAGLEFAVAECLRDIGVGNLSLYSGGIGVALASAEVASRLDIPSLTETSLPLAQRISETVLDRAAELPNCDLIGGLGGIAVGLVAMYRHLGDPLLLNAARAACNEIASRAEFTWCGCSWPESQDTVGLCGLGHGASGIGWALAETAWETGDTSLMALAEEAFRYERSWFSREQCAWPDLRQPDAQVYTTAWCHGGLGIGAVRLRIFEAMGADWALAEASAAIEAARTLAVQGGRQLANGTPSDVTLCHGLGGAAELALLAHEVLGISEHGRAAHRIADLCLKIRSANDCHWTNGLKGAKQVPGLFLGQAGIGVMMMRMHDSFSIGSPLLAGRKPQISVLAKTSTAKNPAQRIERL